jgi:hypothetical protein
MKNLFVKKEWIIGAANELSADGGQVLRIPYGDYGNSRGKQKLTKDAAEAMVSAFNEKGRDLPFYIGHPDEESFFAKYRDHAAYGWITAMVANEEALELTVDWNEDGEKLLKGRKFRWWSPRFLCRVMSVANEKILVPLKLASCGLTHEPNMDLEPVVNEEDEPQQGESDMELLNRLIALIGKDDVKSEDDVVGFVQKLMDGMKAIKKAQEERWKAEDAAYQATATNEDPSEMFAGLMSVIDGKHQTALSSAANETPVEAKQQITTLEEQVSAANEALDASRKAHSTLLINQALEAGRITPAQKESWEGKFDADFVSAANELASSGEALHTESSVSHAAERSATVQDRQGKILSAVNEEMERSNLSYHDAFQKVKKEKPALFAAK